MRLCAAATVRRGGVVCSGARRCSGGEGGEGVVVGARRSEGGGWALTGSGAAADSEGEAARQLGELGGRLREGRAFGLRLRGRAGAVACVGAAGAGAGAGYDPREALHCGREAVRCGVGAAVRLLAERGVPRIRVDGCGAPDAAAEGATLAAWRFQEFKAGDERLVEPEVSLLTEAAEPGAAEAWREGAVRAEAQNWARWLADMPANKLAPTELAQAALDALCPLGVHCEARDRVWMEEQNMRCALAVARGSCEPPVFLELAYDGPGADARPVLLCAKGVTFDSGGLCLKSAARLSERRGSMAGAAAVLAAFRAIATLQAPLKLRAAIPLCENMISGQCMKVGDVVTALNGLSIQIEDTDMEGRLLLADALVYGQALHRPALVVTLATLTRGALLATGSAAFAAFATSEAAWGGVQRAGAEAGDRPWRLPLWHYYTRQLTNESAVDLRNRGSGHASACLGAAFLKHFVCGEWTHWDITGVVRPPVDGPAPPYLAPLRMTGRPTRALVHYLTGLVRQGTGHGEQAK